jgi:hypothetical protein
VTRVTVQTRSAIAGDAAVREEKLAGVRALAAEFGTELKPLHPDVAHPLLDRYFVADVGDKTRADALIQRLLQDPHVEAAYVAPAPELP